MYKEVHALEGDVQIYTFILFSASICTLPIIFKVVVSSFRGTWSFLLALLSVALQELESPCKINYSGIPNFLLAYFMFFLCFDFIVF